MLKRDKHSLEFTLTRLFMKLFCTASPAIVTECQVQFRFINSTNSLCMLLAAHARASLTSLLSGYREAVASTYDLRVAASDLMVQ